MLGPLSVNVGVSTETGRGVDTTIEPDFPVTVMLYWPGLAELAAVKVMMVLLVAVAGENEAVTPAGSPEAEN